MFAVSRRALHRVCDVMCVRCDVVKHKRSNCPKNQLKLRILLILIIFVIFFHEKILRIFATGIILRDSHGVAQVRFVSGNKILRIMKALGLKPDIPEDLYYLIKKAVAIRKHLERSRKDKDSKFRLILVESRIHRLSRFYKTKSVLPPTWKYESSTASALVA